MSTFTITDWDDAYTNGAHVPNGNRWPEAWVEPAENFRHSLRERDSIQCDVAYGEHIRNRYDLLLPQGKPAGLFVFVHGGYWMALDKSYWSHLAAGAIERGWAVAIPSYRLCPEVNIPSIIEMIGRAIEHASAKITGPIVLAGHSAGGHLVASMATSLAPLSANVQSRVNHILSISGVHDLRPLLNTAMNQQLQLSVTSATELSPALQIPKLPTRLTAWVGSAERSEFVRQSELITNIWRGLGAETQCIIAPDKHHFNVIDDLSDANSALVNTLFTRLP